MKRLRSFFCQKQASSYNLWFLLTGLLSDPAKFLESLFKYDKENIPEAVIQKIQPYIDNPVFTPANIEKVSKACTSLCQWVR